MKKTLIRKKKATPRGSFKTPPRDVYVYFNSENNSTFGAGICEIPPGSSNQMHSHADANEVIYVISGTMLLINEGEEYILEQGDAVLIQKHQQHQIFNASKTRKLSHTFTFAGTAPADAIGKGYGNSNNFTIYPAEEQI